MKRAVFLHIEQLLKDYSGINNFIAEIEKSPYFSVNDQRRIMTLKQEQNAVRDAISNTDEDTLETIEGNTTGYLIRFCLNLKHTDKNTSILKQIRGIIADAKTIDYYHSGINTVRLF